VTLFDERELELFPESGLTCRLSERTLDDDDGFAQVLILKFAGSYRRGSAGTPDAEYMVAMLGAALARFSPDAVVFDFMELEYEGGNSLLGVLMVLEQWAAPDPPRLVIAAGPASLPALRSLVTPVGAEPPAWLLASRDAAIEFGLKLASERSRRR
jgi:hypothetical protein